MAPDAPQAAVATAARFTRQSRVVDTYSYTSQSDAYRQFAKVAGDKDLVATVKPRDLPPSFDIRLLESADRRALARHYQHLSGVEAVEVAPSCASVRRFAARAGPPKDFIHRARTLGCKG